MSMQVLGPKTLGRSLDETGAESILNRIDALIDRQDWVEELYGSLAPPQPRSLADELDFYNSIDVGLQRSYGEFQDEFRHHKV